MLIGWLIYSAQDVETNQSFIHWLIEEADLQQIELTLIQREALDIGIVDGQWICHIHQKSVPLPDFAIVRTVEPLLNLQLENMGIHVFNSSTVSRLCNHKMLTHFEMNKLNIPMVDTLFMKSKNLTEEPPMPYPFVMKAAVSHGGGHVFLINNKNEWLKQIKKIPTGDVLIQSCHVQLGKDVRVFVVGQQIIGAVLRQSVTDFRANYKLGGDALWYPLNDDEKHLVNRIINHFQFGMVGIDFFIGLDGQLIFNEIEDVVGSRTLSQVSKTNIARDYMTWIKKATATN